MCDLFLPSLEDMIVLTGLSDPDAIIDWGHEKGAATVVLKLGSEGARISDRAAGGEHHLRRLGRQLAPGIRCAGLDDDGPALQRPRHVERAAHLEVLALVIERAHARRVDHEVAARERRAVLRVRDRGPGVSAEDRPRIFERFR